MMNPHLNPCPTTTHRYNLDEMNHQHPELGEPFNNYIPPELVYARPGTGIYRRFLFTACGATQAFGCVPRHLLNA